MLQINSKLWLNKEGQLVELVEKEACSESVENTEESAVESSED